MLRLRSARDRQEYSSYLHECIFWWWHLDTLVTYFYNFIYTHEKNIIWLLIYNNVYEYIWYIIKTHVKVTNVSPYWLMLLAIEHELHRPSAFATLMCVVSASVMRYRHIGLRRHFLNRWFVNRIKNAYTESFALQTQRDGALVKSVRLVVN